MKATKQTSSFALLVGILGAMTVSCTNDPASTPAQSSAMSSIEKCDGTECNGTTKKDGLKGSTPSAPVVETNDLDKKDDAPQPGPLCSRPTRPIDLTMCITGDMGNGCQTREDLQKQVTALCARQGTNGVLGLEATTIKFDDSHVCTTDNGLEGVPSAQFSCCVPGAPVVEKKDDAAQLDLLCKSPERPIDLTMCITGDMGNGCQTRDELQKEVTATCARQGTNGVLGLETTTIKFDDSHKCTTNNGLEGVPSARFSCCVPGT